MHPSWVAFLVILAAASGCGGAPRIPAGVQGPCPNVVGVTPEVMREASLATVDAYLTRQGWLQSHELTEIPAGPELKNARQVQTAIMRLYPPHLRAAGIGGTSVMRLLIGPAGRVTHAAVLKGSGHIELDRAAAEAVRETRFEPYVRQGCTLQVLVDVPIRLWVQ